MDCVHLVLCDCVICAHFLCRPPARPPSERERLRDEERRQNRERDPNTILCDRSPTEGLLPPGMNPEDWEPVEEPETENRTGAGPEVIDVEAEEQEYGPAMHYLTHETSPHEMGKYDLKYSFRDGIRAPRVMTVDQYHESLRERIPILASWGKFPSGVQEVILSFLRGGEHGIRVFLYRERWCREMEDHIYRKLDLNFRWRLFWQWERGTTHIRKICGIQMPVDAMDRLRRSRAKEKGEKVPEYQSKEDVCMAESLGRRALEIDAFLELPSARRIFTDEWRSSIGSSVGACPPRPQPEGWDSGHRQEAGHDSTHDHVQEHYQGEAETRQDSGARQEWRSESAGKGGGRQPEEPPRLQAKGRTVAVPTEVYDLPNTQASTSSTDPLTYMIDFSHGFHYAELMKDVKNFWGVPGKLAKAKEFIATLNPGHKWRPKDGSDVQWLVLSWYVVYRHHYRRDDGKVSRLLYMMAPGWGRVE